VGKSAVGRVALKYYLHADKFSTIIVDFHGFQVMYQRSDHSQPWTISIFDQMTLPLCVDDASTLLLYDCRKDYPSPPIVLAATVAFSSPNKSQFGPMAKNTPVSLLPLWGLDELLFAGPRVVPYLTDDIIQANFAIAGGTARSDSIGDGH